MNRETREHVDRAREAAERVRDACQQAILDLGEALAADDEGAEKLKNADERESAEGSTLRSLAAVNEARVRLCIDRCCELARGLARVGLAGRRR